MKPLRYLAVLCVVVMIAVPSYASGKSSKNNSKSKSGKTTLDAPKLSCSAGASGASIDLTVKAGKSGAPAGFTVHWILKSEQGSSRIGSNSGGGGDHDDDDDDDGDHHHDGNCGHDHDDDDHGEDDDDDDDDSPWCQASFSGNARGHHFRLGPGQSVTINIGDSVFDTPGASSACENDPLECGKQYVFKAFAHADKSKRKSKWSATTVCSTADCGGGGGDEFGCTLPGSAWFERGPTASPDEVLWPVNGLTIGNIFYTNLQLESILGAAPGSNGLIALAQQLIAAKMNVANGASDSSVASAILSADSLIGNLIVPPVGSGSLPTSATSALTTTLQNFNEGSIGPGPCE